MNPNPDNLDSWIGVHEEAEDIVTPAACAAMAATLGSAAATLPGTHIGALWHWMFFSDTVPAAALGEDGHPAHGGFLPPIGLPRRMFAGARVRFEAPLRVGDPIRRRREIVALNAKEGRSGPLFFVTVGQSIHGPLGLAVREEQDLVFRARPITAPDTSKPRTPSVALPDAPIIRRKRIVPDSVLLFRYSALTFNGHRIHYDRPYATDVEGYPGLVVHGPLIATLLADFARETSGGRPLAQFDFRAIAPAFVDTPIDLLAYPPTNAEEQGVRLYAVHPDGGPVMTAHVTYRPLHDTAQPPDLSK